MYDKGWQGGMGNLKKFVINAFGTDWWACGIDDFEFDLTVKEVAFLMRIIGSLLWNLIFFCLGKVLAFGNLR